MNITREVLEDYHEKITISLAKDDYWDNVKKALKRYGNKASIKGFRPGKIPPALVKKMYGNQIMAEEVSQLLSEKLQGYLKEENLSVLGRPLAMFGTWPVIDVKQPEDYDFGYEIGLSPKFEIDLLNGKGKTFTYYKVEATDANIDEEIERQQIRHGNANTIEENATVEEGDNVFFKLVEILPEVSDEEEGREPLVRENAIPTDMLTEKGSKAIIGMKIGDSKKINLFDAIRKNREDVLRFILMATAEEYPDLGDKFQIEVTKISRITAAELDKDFFAKVLGLGEAETEEDFRTRLKEEIEKGNNQYTQRHLHNDFVNSLMETTNVILPTSFLQKYFSASLEQPIPAEYFEKEFSQYQQATRWNLIRNEIAKQKELKVEEEEIDVYIYSDIQRQLMQYAPQLLSDPERVNQFVENMKADRKYIEQAYLRILDDKIFATLEEIAKIEEKVVSSEEYEAIVKAANEADAAEETVNDGIEDAVIVEEKKPAKKTRSKKATGDNLTKVEGIGPKIASLFVAAGYDTFAKLAKAKTEDLEKILAENNLAHHKPGTWARQAQMAADGKWDELEKWQDELDGGKEVK